MTSGSVSRRRMASTCAGVGGARSRYVDSSGIAGQHSFWPPLPAFAILSAPSKPAETRMRSGWNRLQCSKTRSPFSFHSPFLLVFAADASDAFSPFITLLSLIYSIIDVLLGGGRGTSAVRVEGRPYTTIETNLVQQMVALILQDAEQAFAPSRRKRAAAVCR